MPTNFLQFNPGKANSESDSAYSADAMRSAGATTAAILASPLFNKFAYQVSTFCAAFAQALSNKGYTISDEDYAALVTALMNVKTANEFLQSIVTVPYATSISFNAGVSAQFDLTLTGNVTSSSLTGQTAGQVLLFIISQDGTGNRTFSWPAAITAPGAICPLANSISIQMFVVRPAGAIDPITQMLWTTAAGLRIPNTAVASINANGNVSAGYQEIVEAVNAGSGAITRTLYTAAGYMGSKVNVKKMDATTNPITVAAQPGQTIDGQPNFQLFRQFDSITLISDNSNWVII